MHFVFVCVKIGVILLQLKLVLSFPSGNFSCKLISLSAMSEENIYTYIYNGKTYLAKRKNINEKKIEFNG